MEILWEKLKKLDGNSNYEKFNRNYKTIISDFALNFFLIQFKSNLQIYYQEKKS